MGRMGSHRAWAAALLLLVLSAAATASPPAEEAAPSEEALLRKLGSDRDPKEAAEALARSASVSAIPRLLEIRSARLGNGWWPPVLRAAHR